MSFAYRTVSLFSFLPSPLPVICAFVVFAFLIFVVIKIVTVIMDLIPFL